MRREVHGTTTVTPSCAKRPIDANSAPASSNPIVLATSAPGRSAPPPIAESSAS